jgi:hypothetical protein
MTGSNPNEAPTIGMVRDVVVRHFPHLWPGLEAALSTPAALILKDVSHFGGACECWQRYNREYA